MPIISKRLDKGSGFLSVAYGSVTTTEIKNNIKKIFLSEEIFRKYTYGLIDFSETDNVTVTNHDIRKMAEQNIKEGYVNDHLIVAIVVEKDIDYGLARMWEAYITGLNWESYVFRSRQEAESWIKEKVKFKHGLEITMK